MADSTPKQSGPCFPARYIFTGLISIGLAIIYGLKVNLSVAVVAMINNTALNELRAAHHEATHGNVTYKAPEFACPSYDPSNSTEHSDDGPFAWTEPIQGYILASYFWGYIVTQMPGGRIAEMYSAKWMIWGCVFLQAVMSLLTPPAAYLSYIAVIVVRIIEGLGAGVSLPAIHVMLSKWAPPAERNRISSLAYAGMAVGTVISLPFSGILAQTLGWEWIFYVQGGLTLIWCVAWIIFIFDSPQEHPRIHPVELQMFEETMPSGGGHGGKHAALPVPWKSILTSAPFWAILVAHVCNNFGWYMLLVELPTYMKQILRFKISENGLLSAIPYLSMFIFSVLWSNLLDFAKGKGVTTTVIRKVSTALAALLPAACFVGVAMAGCDRNIAVTLMTLGTMFFAGMYGGFLANHIDIASNYAGTLMAITNSFATISGFVVPAFVGELTHGEQSVGAWQIIFYTTAGVLLVELVVYSIFGSGEEQEWNKAHSTTTATDATTPEEAESLNKKSQA